MHAIPSHFVPLATVLQTGVAHVHDAFAHEGGVDALLRLLEGLGVPRDQDRPLEVHHLRSNLEALAEDLLETAIVEVLHRLLQGDHVRDGLAQLPAVDLDLPDAQPRPRGLRAPGLHALVVRLDAHRGDGAPAAALVSHNLVPTAPADIAVCELDPLVLEPPLDNELWGVARAVPVDRNLRDVGRLCEEDLDPLLFPVAPPKCAPAAPVGVGLLVNGLVRRLLSRDVDPRLRADDRELPARGRADALDVMLRGHALRSSHQADAVADSPIHAPWIVLHEELCVADVRILRQQRPRPLQLPTMDVDTRAVPQRRQESIADLVVAVRGGILSGDVHRGLVGHRLPHSPELEVAALLDQQVAGP
mmetsp:Transcript_37676/g.106844  ORF Transcript_37676/g.106844 Transcript_37676/m.106844 type:complete len:361 (-) Transcript_37676:373-1455(-)